jgi:hypothetical protein
MWMLGQQAATLFGTILSPPQAKLSSESTLDEL